LSESSPTPIVINVTASNLDGEPIRMQVPVPKELAEAVRKTARLKGVNQRDVVSEALIKFFGIRARSISITIIIAIFF
jgi:hypothetical protein